MATQTGLTGSISNVGSLLNLILGQKTVTTSNADTSALQDSYSRARGNATDPTKTKSLIDNIMQQAAIDFAGTAQGKNTVGLYNTNVHTLLQGWSKATATQKAADAVLNYQTAQDQIAAQSAAAIARAKGTSTATQGGLSPTMALAGTVGLGGLAAFKYRKDIANLIDETFSEVPLAQFGEEAGGVAADFAGAEIGTGGQFTGQGYTFGDNQLGAYTPDYGQDMWTDTASLTEAATGIDAISGEDISSGVSDIGVSIGLDAAAAAPEAVGVVSGGADLLDGTLSFGDLAAEGITETVSIAPDIGSAIFDGAGEAFSMVSDIYNPTGIPFFPTMVNLAEASPLGDVPVVGDVIGVVDSAYDAVNQAIGGVIENVFGGKLICTELHAQGLMSDAALADDIRWSYANVSETTRRGYQFWAMPLVKLMRRSKFVTWIVAPFALARVQQIQHLCGHRETPDHFGRIIIAVGHPICFFLGLFVPQVSWGTLYKEV